MASHPRPSHHGPIAAGSYGGGTGSVASGPRDVELDGDGDASSRREAMFGLGEVARILQETIYGIVAVMSRGKQKRLSYALAEALLVSTLFLLFPLQLFSWPGAGPALEQVRDGLRLAFPFRSSALSYNQFLGAFWTAVSLIAVSLSTAVYTGYAFATQDFKVMWPLRFLRFVISYFVVILYMPLISLLTKVFNCPLPSGAAGSAPAFHIDFPEMECWTRTHLALFIVACVMAGSFIVFATITQLLFFEPNFRAVGPDGERDLFSRPHSRVDTVFFLLNSLLSVLSNVDAVPRDVLAVMYIASGTVMSYLLLNFFPYHRLSANMYQTAVTFAYTYASILCLAERAGRRGDFGLTVAMAAGLVPAFLAGAAASWLRFRLVLCTGRIADVATIRRAVHIEIAARFVFEAGPGDAEAVEAADAVFRAGIEKFPHSAALLIAHSFFCFSYTNSPDLAFERIRQAAKLRPGFDLRFVIYRRELERQHSAHAIDMGDARYNITDHIEYKTNMTGARKSHRTALRAVKRFWTLLSAEALDSEALEACLARLDKAEHKADGHYRALLARYPRAPRVLRSYGRFQAEVLNDEAAAQQLFDAADDCETVPGAAHEVGSVSGRGAGSVAGFDALAGSAPAPALSPTGAGAGAGPAPPTPRGPLLASLVDAAASLLTRRRWVRVRPDHEHAHASSPETSSHGAGPGGPLVTLPRSVSARPSVGRGRRAGALGGPPALVQPAGELRADRPPGGGAAAARGGHRQGRRPAPALSPSSNGSSARRSAAHLEIRVPVVVAAAAGHASLPETPTAAGPASPGSLASPFARLRPPRRAAGARSPPRPHTPREPDPAPASPGLAGMAATLGGPLPPAPAPPGYEAPEVRVLSSPESEGASDGGTGDERPRAPHVHVLPGPAAPGSSKPTSPSAKDGAEAEGFDGADGEGAGEAGSRDEARERRRMARRWHKVKARVKGAGDAHAASIRRMKLTVRAVLAVVSAVAAANFAVVTFLISTFERAIWHVAESGARRRLSAAVALYSQASAPAPRPPLPPLLRRRGAQWLTLAGRPEWDPAGDLEGRARRGLVEAAGELEATHLKLYEDGARADARSIPPEPARV
eukprot:tig00000605_g2491.t1